MTLIDDSKVPTATLDSIKSAALGIFDDCTHIAVGTDATATSVGDTTLGAEVDRNAFDETPVKNEGAGTYDFSTSFGLTEANGNTLAEAGLFNDPTTGIMRLRALLPAEVEKTASIELSVGIRINIIVENE